MLPHARSSRAVNIHERDGKRYRDELLSDMRKRMEQKLAHQATHDLLTGRPNRSVFEDQFRQAVARPRRQSGIAALLYLDLDRFKRINHTLGHLAGDTLIQFAAERLAGCLRESETLSRSGGDRFTLASATWARPKTPCTWRSGFWRTVAAVFGEGQRGVSGRQHRHRALPAGWRGSARLATGGGQRAVRGQAPGRAHPVVQPGNQPGGQPPLGRRDRTSPCLGARRNIGALPAAIRFGHRPRGRIGGAGALGQSEVRTSPAIRSDSYSGRERAHHADRRPRAARRLPPGQVVAGRRLWAHAGGRQYFSRAIRAGRSGRNRGGHARRDGPGGVAPGPGSHRERDHARYPGNCPAAQGTEETGGEPSPWTTLGPAI